MKTKILIIITALLFLIIGACKKKESQFEIYENHDISACGVEDPLRNIDWLVEYCRKIKEQKDREEYIIYLLKVIGKEEYVFKTSWPSQIEHYYSINYRNCSGDIIFHWETITPPSPYYEDFMEDKEYVAELFHLIKQ
jgi:hypothetical protein